ncbi:hypothetical protein D9M68_860290 [compost metagenome]
MVIRLAGYSRSELTIALLTRSFASSIDLLPRPTICKEGRPLVSSLSASMRRPSNPTGATVKTLATISDIFSKTYLLAPVNNAILCISIGADFSFRRKEFNRLFCKSTIRVTYIF